MFSLIIAIVSIALVVALVAATSYHGGDTVTKARATASASEVVSAGQQVMGALTMHHALNGAYPSSIDELMTGGMLKSLPQLAAADSNSGGFELVPSAHAELVFDDQWGYDAIAPHLVYRSNKLTAEVCAEVNRISSDAPIVLTEADASHLTAQCVSTPDGLLVLFINGQSTKTWNAFCAQVMGAGSSCVEGALKTAMTTLDGGNQPYNCVWGCDPAGTGGSGGSATPADYGSIRCNFSYNGTGNEATIDCVTAVGDSELNGMRARPMYTSMEYASLDLSCTTPGGATLSASGGMGKSVYLSEAAPKGSVCIFTGTLYPGNPSFSSQGGLNQVIVETINSGESACYVTSPGENYCGPILQ